MSDLKVCPRCGRNLIYRHQGIMRWKACPAKKACGWSVLVAATNVEKDFSPVRKDKP